jgi:hypothetical protein
VQHPSTALLSLNNSAPQFTQESVRNKYPRLVTDYSKPSTWLYPCNFLTVRMLSDRRFKDGTLSDFDPSSIKVHPRYRLTIRLKPRQFSKRGKGRSRSTRSSTATKPSDEDDDDDAVVISSDDSDSDSQAAPVRHSTRLAKLPQYVSFPLRDCLIPSRLELDQSVLARAGFAT